MLRFTAVTDENDFLEFGSISEDISTYVIRFGHCVVRINAIDLKKSPVVPLRHI